MKRLMWIALGWSMVSGVSASAQKVLVVANPSVHPDQLSTEQVRAIFTGGETNLKGGAHLLPILLRGGPVHEAFLKELIGKQDSSFRLAWRALVFSGQASMPRSAEDEADMVSYVARTPGAIGYISNSTPHEHVVVLRVR